MLARIVIASLGLLLLGGAPAPAHANLPAGKIIAATCGDKYALSDPAPAVHIHGHTWYVGTCGVTLVLIETKAGLVLIDSGPADAAPQLLASIGALRFDPKEVKWIRSSHEHFGHGCGIAGFQKANSARLAVGPPAAHALRTGRPYPEDSQAAWLAKYFMAPAQVDRALSDGRSLVLGGLKITAHATLTHSPGPTSLTWQSCEGGHLPDYRLRCQCENNFLG